MGKPIPLSVSAAALAILVTTTAASHAGRTLAQRLDAIAEWGVKEKHAVGIVAAAISGNDVVLLKAYGKPNVE